MTALIQSAGDVAVNEYPPAQCSRAELRSATWVVDLASRRVFRADATCQRPSAQGEDLEWREEERISNEPPSLPALPPRGGVAPSLGVELYYGERYESMSSPETTPLSIDREAIEVRAYAIYCSRGCLDGQDVDDWLEAERQLRAEAGAQAATRPEAGAAESEPAELRLQGSA